MRTLTYFVASSLDGFIAAPDGTFDAFPMEGEHIATLIREYPETMPGPALAAMGITSENRTFDTVIMGWNTYDVGRKVGLGSPYPHLRQYVCSRSHAGAEVPSEVHLSSEDPRTLVRRLKHDPSDRGIWLCGGGSVAAALMDDIDELVIKLNPIRLGTGIPLFAAKSYGPQAYELREARVLGEGVVMCRYSRK